MQVPDRPQLYVLGCFAQYVTVYAQQVRAFNLVDALVGNGQLTNQSEVAVIGGGIAGLTAAAAAAVRGVRRAAVFEKLGNTMRIQRGTDKRFIHPHIYDWPGKDDATQHADNRAGHDILDWTADSAADVVEQLDRGWKSVQSNYPAAEDPCLDCGGIKLERGGAQWAVEAENHAAECFDVVVLAVGFGRDSSEGTESYWTDTSLDDMDQESGGTWFVSGYGDGGLTDLMRLCIMDFRHRTVLEQIDKETRSTVGGRLRDAHATQPSASELRDVFIEAAKAVKPSLDASLRKRKLGQVLLNCADEKTLFSGRSSILNRLIAAYLLLDGRFTLHPGGAIDLPVGQTSSGRYRIKFKDGPPPLEADRVIIRHGPSPVIEADFPDVRTRGMKATWRSLPQLEDWTREPLYAPGAFAVEGAPIRVRSPLRADLMHRVGSVLITSTKTPAGLSQRDRLEYALARYKQRRATGQGRDLATEPAEISAIDALATPASYEWTVRALCDADIAVFDVTGFESAVMLLLGIRSAVRRGVTLTVSQDPSPESLLPFNLAALNPIPLESVEAIAAAMEAGMFSLQAQRDGYLDLPAYDAVRNLGDEYRPVPPEQEILVLRWFDKQYGRLIKDPIAGAVLQACGDATDVVTTLDSRSPQLVSQRLYAAIRRIQLCIVDWTGWRPNVFFENGVRLAVNPVDPVVILCTEEPPGWNSDASSWPVESDPSAQPLKDFFQPLKFTFATHKDIGEHLIMRRPPSSAVARGCLSPGRTYQVVSESIRRDLEPGGEPLDAALLREAQRIAGPGVPEEGGFPLLYSNVLADQAREHAVEILLATWHYLDRRDARNGAGVIEQVRAGVLPASDPHVEPLRSVGQELSARLRNTRGRDYAAVRKEILRALDALDAADGEATDHA